MDHVEQSIVDWRTQMAIAVGRTLHIDPFARILIEPCHQAHNDSAYMHIVFLSHQSNEMRKRIIAPPITAEVESKGINVMCLWVRMIEDEDKT